MADTKTLDERICERARQDLSTAMDNAVTAFWNAIPDELKRWSSSGGRFATVKQLTRTGDRVSPNAEQALHIIKHAVYDDLVSTAEDRARRSFLERLEQLTSEVKEIRDVMEEQRQ